MTNVVEGLFLFVSFSFCFLVVATCCVWCVNDVCCVCVCVCCHCPFLYLHCYFVFCCVLFSFVIFLVLLLQHVLYGASMMCVVLVKFCCHCCIFPTVVMFLFLVCLFLFCAPMHSVWCIDNKCSEGFVISF